MKNLLIFSLFLSALVIPLSSTYAASTISVETTSPVSFGVDITDINKMLSTGLTRFDFKIVDVVNGSLIDHWKIRISCEKQVSVTVDNQSQNGCGKAIEISPASIDDFSVSLSNPTKKTVGFSFKLKAYDVNGKWLHSEKESFRWK